MRILDKHRDNKEHRFGMLSMGDRFGQRTLVAIVFSAGDGTQNEYLMRCDCGTVRWASRGRARRLQSCNSCNYRGLPSRKRLSPTALLLRQYRRGAESRGLEFSITEEQFAALVADACHYCGGLPSRPNNEVRRWRSGQDSAVRHNGVDRVDSSRGYAPDNVVACCGTCNMMKKTLPVDVFISKALQIAARHTAER